MVAVIYIGVAMFRPNTVTGDHSYLPGMVYIKTYIFQHFFEQYLVLLTMVPRKILRGTIVNRTYVTHKSLYISLF